MHVMKHSGLGAFVSHAWSDMDMDLHMKSAWCVVMTTTCHTQTPFIWFHRTSSISLLSAVACTCEHASLALCDGVTNVDSRLDGLDTYSFDVQRQSGHMFCHGLTCLCLHTVNHASLNMHLWHVHGVDHKRSQ